MTGPDKISLTHAKRHIAQSASEMIGTAVISFQALRHPRYYEGFLKDLHYTIARVPELTARKEAERILSGLAGNL